MNSGIVVRPPRTVVDRVAHGLDGFIVSQMMKLSPDETQTAAARLEDFAAIQDELASSGALEDDAIMYPDPGFVGISKRILAPHRVGFQEWRWPSHHPIIFEKIENDYRWRKHNQTARLRILKLKPKGSTMAIIINGFSSGHHIIERFAWPVQMFRRQGIGASLFALPFHGPRTRVFPPEWPGEDLRMVIEGFRQAIWDLRIAIRALRQQGAKRVGVIGMSLGGFTASLLATVSDDADFVIPYVPIGSIADFMDDNGLVPSSGAQQSEMANAFRRHMDVICPLSRPPVISPERITVISGELDRLATVDQGANLAAHFGCRHVIFRGAHLIQKGRARAFKDAFAELRRNGVLPAR
ncbi:MAG: alpha/beta hydrolase [Polyangiales bacterium]